MIEKRETAENADTAEPDFSLRVRRSPRL